MTIDRSARFIQAAQNLELTPLLNSAQIDAFRIDYGRKTIQGLKNKLKLDINPKVIFTGHTGSGKSTLLARFAQEMTDNGKFVAFFSIANMVEMSQVNHINVLYSIALTLLIRAEEESVSVLPRIKEDLEEWFLTTKTKTYSDELKGELKGGFDIFKILRDVYDKFMPPDTMEPAFLNLLHTLCVLEYENDDLWYDLHPIIVDLLQRKKVIPLTV